MSDPSAHDGSTRDAPPPTRPAATLVLLRLRADGSAGFEVLLTKRPATMRFGPGMWVFPGGRVERGESARVAAVRETAEETGIQVGDRRLVPLTRWVTPPSLRARFDARFYAAVVVAGTDVVRPSDEVAAWAWLDPTSALEAMAAGRLPMWQPTVVTLQQLETIGSRDELRVAFFPGDGPAADDGWRPSEVRRRFDTTWAGGIRGRVGTTWAVGRRAWVLVDPPDPTSGTLTAALRAADKAGARLAGIVVRDLAPEHHAGVEMFARGLGLPVAGPPGANALVPYAVQEIEVGEPVPFGDSGLRVVEVGPAHASSARQRWAARAGRLRLRVR